MVPIFHQLELEVLRIKGQKLARVDVLGREAFLVSVNTFNGGMQATRAHTWNWTYSP